LRTSSQHAYSGTLIRAKTNSNSRATHGQGAATSQPRLRGVSKPCVNHNQSRFSITINQCSQSQSIKVLQIHTRYGVKATSQPRLGPGVSKPGVTHNQSRFFRSTHGKEYKPHPSTTSGGGKSLGGSGSPANALVFV